MLKTVQNTLRIVEVVDVQALHEAVMAMVLVGVTDSTFLHLVVAANSMIMPHPIMDTAVVHVTVAIQPTLTKRKILKDLRREGMVEGDAPAVAILVDALVVVTLAAEIVTLGDATVGVTIATRCISAERLRGEMVKTIL